MHFPILIAGDSYSLNWPAQFSKLVPNPIKNISSRGRSNLFIWSSTVNYLARVKTKHTVIVGNSFITRKDTWVENQINKKTWDEVQHPERKNGNLSMPLQHYDKKYEEWLELRTYVHYGKNIIIICFVLLIHSNRWDMIFSCSMRR